MRLEFTLSLCCFIFFTVTCNFIYNTNQDEDKKMRFIEKLIRNNWKPNGWHTIMIIGNFPDQLYRYLQDRGDFVTFSYQREAIEYEEENIINYYPNTVLINCTDLNELAEIAVKIKESYYFHYHSNIIIYYHTKEDDVLIAKIFYILWYQKLSNTILLMYDKETNTFSVIMYNPYTNENYQLEKNFGCWTVEKIGFTVTNFTAELKCEPECDRVTLHSVRRAEYFGTCIGLSILTIDVYDTLLQTLHLFEDRSLNLHGITLRAHATDVVPFLRIADVENDTYTISSRDGMIWNTLAEKMNFKIDLSPSKKQMRRKFNFELNIKQIFDMSLRRVDLFLLPIYLMDVTLMPIEYTHPFKESGVCFITRRAEYQNIFINMLNADISAVIEFIACILSVWTGLFLFSSVEHSPGFDQAGRHFLNAIRIALSIPLCNPPTMKYVKIMFLFTFWGFFIINFALQASIISTFSASKRGIEVDTLQDVTEKGYPIIGMSSPDLFLPETEEVYRKIIDKFTPTNNMYDCLEQLENNSKIFCLLECSMARYMEKNKLNTQGQQFLHVATDRIHNMYLALILPLQSSLKYRIIDILVRLIEAGLIAKWEEYKITDIVEESEFKPLSLNDIMGIFHLYLMSVSLACILFVGELILGFLSKCAKQKKI